MSGAALQGLYDQGYAIAASVLGTPYKQYRASGADNPISPLNMVATINAWLTTDAKLMGAAQPQYGKPIWYGSFGRSAVDVGDYLVGADGTFFVSALSYPAAPSLVWCNDTLTITRASLGLSAGASSGYFGDTSAAQSSVLQSWPGSLLLAGSGTTGRPTGMNLPSDVKLPIVNVLLPFTAPAIQFNDVLTDTAGSRYYVSMAEQSPLGWRLSAQQVAI